MNINSQLLRRAIGEAKKSHMLSRHGAILIRGHKVVAVGHNHSNRAWISRGIHLPSTHAELACCRRIVGQPREGKERKAQQEALFHIQFGFCYGFLF